MMLQITLLFLAVPFSLTQGCQIPLVNVLPESSFSATSAFNDSVKASNLRFMTEEPWCPATDAYDKDEFVVVDLGCARSVCQVEGRDPNLLFYTGEYSNDYVTWTKLESDVNQTYDPWLGFEANNKAEIRPSVRARYFRFRLPYFAYSDERKGLPCAEMELYANKTDDSVEPIGCFQEKLRPKSRRAMPVTFHSVRGVNTRRFPDILAIYEECRQKAEEFSNLEIEVFGIRDKRRCVTTETGKEDEYSKYGESSKCKVCSGKGIGTGRKSIFVYKKKTIIT